MTVDDIHWLGPPGDATRRLSERRRHLSGQLELALRAGAVALHYQPQLHFGADRLVGAEALLRWHDSLYGPVSPNEAMAVADASGQSEQLVMAMVAALARDWDAWVRNARTPPPRIGMDLPASALTARDLPERMSQVLYQHDIRPDQIDLELEEHFLIDLPPPLYPALTRWREAGFALCMDAVAAVEGSANLALDGQFQAFKIERGRIRELCQGGAVPERIVAITAIARADQLRVLALGVETVEQVRRLQQYGLDLGQGQVFDPPLPADALARRWLGKTALRYSTFTR